MKFARICHLFLLLSVILIAACSKGTFSASNKGKTPETQQGGSGAVPGSADIDIDAPALPNGAIDANGNGIPDGAEDNNGNGIPDGAEDNNGNGIPDGNEGGSGNGSSNNGGDGAGGNGSSNGGSGSGGSGGSGTDIFTPGTPTTTSIPTECNPQHILILDFKSGWWAGDGGDMYTKVIQAQLEQACPGKPSTLEYYHILKENAPARFYAKDDFPYTQVWIFSGTLEYKYDIPLDHPGLLEVANKIREKKPNLVFSAGFGCVDHSNRLAQLILGLTPFATPERHDKILHIKGDKPVDAVFSRMISQATGLLFTGITSPMPDAIDADEKKAYSDELLKFTGIKSIGTCKLKDNRTTDCVAMFSTINHKVVFDSGWQRLYASYVSGEETNVNRYLVNIVRVLAK